MIQTKELIYEYEKRDEEGNIIGMKRAIDGVDIDIPEGSFVAILGHNGSGKSTLAKHMNAILVPSGGTMGKRKRYERSGESVGCQTIRRNGISESGQSDHRNGGRRRRRIRTGESGRAGGRDLEAGGRKPERCRNAGVSQVFPKQAFRRAETASCHCGSDRYGTKVYCFR